MEAGQRDDVTPADGSPGGTWGPRCRQEGKRVKLSVFSRLGEESVGKLTLREGTAPAQEAESTAWFLAAASPPPSSPSSLLLLPSTFSLLLLVLNKTGVILRGGQVRPGGCHPLCLMLIHNDLSRSRIGRDFELK